MRDAFAALTFVVGVFVFVIGGMIGLIIGNEYWNCSSYGGQTKMIAGSCYIQTTTGRWITLNSYIRYNKLTVTGEE